jgi:formylglycine-generating enzyme required for sulfatase activity
MDRTTQKEAKPSRSIGPLKTVDNKLRGVEILQEQYDIKSIDLLGKIDRTSPGWLSTLVIFILFFIIALLIYAFNAMVLWLHLPGILDTVTAFVFASNPIAVEYWTEGWIPYWQIVWLASVLLVLLRSDGFKMALQKYFSWKGTEENVLVARIVLILAAIFVRGIIALFIGSFVAFTMLPVVFGLLNLIIQVYSWWLEREAIITILSTYWRISLGVLILLGLVGYRLRKVNRKKLIKLVYLALGLPGLTMIVVMHGILEDPTWILELPFWLTGPWMIDTFSFGMVIVCLIIVYPVGFAVKFSDVLWSSFRVFRMGLFLFRERILLRWKLFKTIRQYKATNKINTERNSWATVCNKHLVRFVKQTEKLSYRRKFRYAVCPVCSSDVKPYLHVESIGLVLSNDMKEDVKQDDKVLRINGLDWLQTHEQKQIPLFDAVVIENVEDHKIEEFITVYQSKQRDFSHKALSEVPCHLASDNQVGQNIENLLNDNFRKVVSGSESNSTLSLGSARIQDEIRQGSFLLRRALIRGFSTLFTLGVFITAGYLYIFYILPPDPASGELDEKPKDTATETTRAKSDSWEISVDTPIPDPEMQIFEMAPGEIIWSERDGMALVFLPAGPFLMGNVDDQKLTNTQDEYPIHEVILNDYFIDLHEVTNKQYRLCVEAGVCDPPQSKVSQKRSDYFTNTSYDDYPVIKISWQDAQTYCQWAGRDLPSEAEWEKAAGWDYQSSQARQYPWGNTNPDQILANYGLQVGDTSPVAQYPQGKSPLGLMDMAGNVWEWVYDRYGRDYYVSTPYEDPYGPEQGSYRVMRGGSWISNSFDLRVSRRHRFAPQDSRFDLGFRCVLRSGS